MATSEEVKRARLKAVQAEDEATAWSELYNGHCTYIDDLEERGIAVADSDYQTRNFLHHEAMTAYANARDAWREYNFLAGK